MDSRHVWHEASLLRACVHPRLVLLLGVACQVGVRGLLGLPTVLPARPQERVPPICAHVDDRP